MRCRACAAFALLAACTPMQWSKQDTAFEQVLNDELECQTLARNEASRTYWSSQRMQGPIVTGPSVVLYSSGAYVDPFANQMLEESRLRHFCMEAKGYKLVPAKQ
jgi:hypothetical protein